MIQETIVKIRRKFDRIESLDEAKRAELHELLSTLESEVRTLSEANPDHAESIASFAHLSAHEASRKERNPHLFKLAVRGFSTSVEGFETTHPRLVSVVNSICTALANVGI